MKLVEQITLVFRKGRTEKVYEIDLCEVGASKFVVNYRYGRRGAALKDGTKTLAPVSEKQARQAYDKLVASKQKAGYVAGEAHAVAPEAPASAAPRSPSAQAPQSPPPAVTTAPTVSDPRAQAVLDRLARGDTTADLPPARRHLAFRRQRGSGDKSWTLSRAIWRAGELAIPSAAPLLAGLIGKDDIHDYCIAWALGRCGRAEGVPALMHLRNDPRAPEHVKNIATASLLELSDGADRLALISELVQQLPEGLRAPAKEGPPEATTEALTALLTKDEAPWQSRDADAWNAVRILYVMNTPFTRHAALSAIRQAPLQPPAFRTVRSVFKLAELRRDGEAFGILARRFDVERQMYNVGEYRSSVPNRSGGNSSMSAEQRMTMMGSTQPSAAFSSKTRWYLRQRVWRTLERLGKLGDPDFVPMAVGVLAPFADADGADGGWAYAYRHLWAFNFLLFQNSQRLSRGRLRWRGPRGIPELTAQREEAFPQLWDRQPQALVHLLSESGCDLVNQFGVRTLRNHGDFCSTLPVDAIAMLLSRPFDVTTRFGFELAQRRYRPGADPDELRALALAVANSVVADIRREGHRWIETNPALFTDSGAVLGSLLASPHGDTRTFARGFIAGQTLSARVIDSLVASMVAHVLRTPFEDLATDITESLSELFPDKLVSIGPEVIVDLAQHGLAIVQGFAAQLMLLDGAASPPEAALAALLDSPHPSVRPFGVRVLSKLDDADLVKRHELVWAMTVHRDAPLREAIRPALARMVNADAELGAMFLQKLIASLLRRRLPEGVPGSIVKVLSEDFRSKLDDVPAEIVWRLLRSESTAAQELGGILLPQHLDPTTVDLTQIVELTSHKILAVRNAAWHAAERVVDRMRAATATAVRLLDADWEDSRVRAFKYFDTHFGKDDFTPIVLVSICDSVRADTQRYGRKLIAEHFDDAHGEEYLLRLSEHPSSDVQLFATNYLERFAAGSTQNLKLLVPYFTRVLSQINRGRAARHRAHAFLRAEALASEEGAIVVATILERQSATAAIEDRASCIETLAAIARTWPNVPLDIEVVATPTRRASA